MCPCCAPTWGGSACSGKSTTLRTVLQHLRPLFQKEGVQAAVELTAYTGVAAFNIGFGAKTTCSAFRNFPNAAFKKELQGEQFRALEKQWENGVILIVDEVSFIGKAFFHRMHCRLQQARRGFVAARGLDPEKYHFGDISMILVGDFGQLEPIEDVHLRRRDELRHVPEADVEAVGSRASWPSTPPELQGGNHAHEDPSIEGRFLVDGVLPTPARLRDDL